MRSWLSSAFVAVIVAAPQFPPAGSSRPPTSPPSSTSGRTQERPPQPRSRSATGDALDRYVRGEYAEAIDRLQGLGGFNIQQADDWIRAAGPAEASRRRLAAATLVLEWADARDAWPAQIVEWACTTFRALPMAGTDEALWLRASIALAAREGVWTFLMPETFGRPAVPTGTAWANAPVPPVIAHLAHARERFPDDPWFRLAEAVGAEVAASTSLDPRLVRTDQTPVAFDRLTSAIGSPDTLPAPQRAQLDVAADRLTPLLAVEPVRDEARLRLAFVELRRGHADAADGLLALAGQSSDPDVRYLAHLFQGWHLAHSGKADAAASAYRAATTDVPHARSAAGLLTATLMMQDRLAEAEAFASAFMDAGASGPDPWASYFTGDGRHYEDLRRQLREKLR